MTCCGKKFSFVISAHANKSELSCKSHNPHGSIEIPRNPNWGSFMRFARLLAALFLTLFLIAPAVEVRAQTAPGHASSKPVVRHPAARKATHPAGNPHMKKNSHPVGAPGTRKHHKWL